MPELPEVETIRKSLEPHVINATIKSVFIGEKKLRWEVDRDAFNRFVVNQTIVLVNRRGKYLIWGLDNKAHVIFHLGMSGRLGIFENGAELEKHTHLIFTLFNGKHIRYRDPRRFGFVEVLNSQQSLSDRFQSLGSEPLSESFSSTYLYHKLKKSNRAIKQIIMDNRIVVGIGNIYANEALFYSGILPSRISASLKKDEGNNLVSSLKKVLKSAIKEGGTTLNDYRNADGEPGFFQQKLLVYARAGETCLKCGHIIEKIEIGQRSTFFCQICQK